MIKATVSGQLVDMENPDPMTIDIHDIAKGLSKICRWGGQLPGDKFFSVAQHSVLCQRMSAGHYAPLRADAKDLQMALLMHDAAEYLTGDMFPPMKAKYGIDELEINILNVIWTKYGVSGDYWEQVHDIDKQSMVTEIVQLMDEPQQAAFEWWKTSKYKPWSIELTCWSPQKAEEEFMQAYVHCNMPTIR